MSRFVPGPQIVNQGPRTGRRFGGNLPVPAVGQPVGASSGPGGNGGLLMEDGTFVLMEDGTFVLME